MAAARATERLSDSSGEASLALGQTRLPSHHSHPRSESRHDDCGSRHGRVLTMNTKEMRRDEDEADEKLCGAGLDREP